MTWSSPPTASIRPSGAGATSAPRSRALENKFAWYGTTQVFDTLTQTFVANEHGTFNAHHYRHSPRDEHVRRRVRRGDLGARGVCRHGRRRRHWPTARRCSPVRWGHRLVSNKSVWRNFPNLRNQRWSVGNTVLIGDALRTAHFSIGSGTRLAMEDAIALNKALAERIFH